MSNAKTSAATVQAIRDHQRTSGATIVADGARSAAITNAYRGAQLTIERSIFSMADRLLPAYRGAYWDFVQLANGGFYFALDVDRQWECSVEGNNFHDSMSGDAAGIVVCLMTYSHMSFHAQGPMRDLIVEHFHKLREHAIEHPEASMIFAAID